MAELADEHERGVLPLDELADFPPQRAGGAATAARGRSDLDDERRRYRLEGWEPNAGRVEPEAPSCDYLTAGNEGAE